VTGEPERLPALTSEEMSPAQRAAAAALIGGRRGALFGPFIALLRSPELLNRAQRLGEYLRYDSALPPRLRELAILITARHFDQAYEWHVHAPEALAAGLAPEALSELAQRHPPTALAPDEHEVYEFCRELHERHQIGDANYGRVRERLGEQGLIDLIGVCGYYALLALVMNAARTPLPEGTEPFAQPSSPSSTAR